jgi:hypothetical protein
LRLMSVGSAKLTFDRLNAFLTIFPTTMCHSSLASCETNCASVK